MKTKVLRLSSTWLNGIWIKAAFFAGVFLSVLILTQTNARSEQPTGVRPVKASEVCMVTDRVMGRPQIPVEVDGKVYYGCCQGCKKRLRNDMGLRFSKDPVTGRRVDKAKAVIIQGTGGEALYFESMDTARRYRVSAAVDEKRN